MFPKVRGSNHSARVLAELEGTRSRRAQSFSLCDGLERDGSERAGRRNLGVLIWSHSGDAVILLQSTVKMSAQDPILPSGSCLNGKDAASLAQEEPRESPARPIPTV